MIVELTRVNDEVWLPKHVQLHVDARVALFKSYDEDVDQTYPRLQEVPKRNEDHGCWRAAVTIQVQIIAGLRSSWIGEDARRSTIQNLWWFRLAFNFASEKLHQEAQFLTIAGVQFVRCIFRDLRARPSTSVPSLVP